MADVTKESPQKTVSQEENDLSARNPMLYDPLSEGQVQTEKSHQYLAALVVCLGAVAAGTALAWTSPVLPNMEYPDCTKINTTIVNNSTIVNNATDTRVFPNGCNANTIYQYEGVNYTLGNYTGLLITKDEKAWIGSLLAIGAFCGAIPAGIIADGIGRRYTAMLMCVPFVIAWLLLIFAQSVAYMYIGRFVIGIATGSFCVVAPMYISEIAEINLRGTLGTLFQLLLTVGILLVYAIGAFVGWQALTWFCLCVPVALFASMAFLPETPVYLLQKGRRGDAALSLKWLWGPYCDSRTAIQNIQADLDQMSGKASFTDLFRNAAAFNGLIISVLLMLFQQMSGINAVIFYTTDIFKSTGSTIDPSVCTIVVGLVQMVMTFVSSLVIERAGRKILLLFGSVSMTICLALLGLYYQLKDGGSDVSNLGWLPLFSVVVFMVTFSVGWGPVPWLMMGELFTADFKATASALTVMSNWFTVFVVTKYFEPMKNSLGNSVTFWFFGLWMVLATFYVLFRVVETKGKSSSEIQMWLSRGK